MFERNVVEKTKTHILCSIFSFSENREVYEIKWKNMVQPVRTFCIAEQLTLQTRPQKMENLLLSHGKNRYAIES